MKKIVLVGSIFLGVLFLFLPHIFSHCEIPCGIYGDEMRIQMIQEHVATIEKATKQIMELSQEKDKNYNQIVRWVINKENHANKIQEIVYQYFMTQRVKPVDKTDADNYKKYVEKIILLHKMLVYAMKTKQSTDPANVERLKALLDDFSSIYFGPKAK